MELELARGKQVIYTPPHLKNSTREFKYPFASQPGFISSVPKYDIKGVDFVFVRYWLLDKDGKPVKDLRTKANSEATPIDCIEVEDVVPQEWVDWAMEEYEV